MGVNGDVNLTSAKYIENDYIYEIFGAVEKFRAEHGIKKSIQIVVEPYSNAQPAGAQLMQFFSDRGYSLETGLLMKTSGQKETIVHNLQISPFGNQFVIIEVGVFD